MGIPCHVGICGNWDAQPLHACGTYYVCPSCRATIERLTALYTEQDAHEAVTA